jgi:hypothetical protein
MLELRAHLRASGAAECLSNQMCAALSAPTPEDRTRLEGLVSAHAAWPVATLKTGT